MKNAEKFKEIFKEFATEVWAFPEKDFLTWLNAEYEEPTTKNDLGVEKIVDVLGSYTDLDIPYKHKIAEDILNNLSSVTPQLSVPEVTALAEWTEKLTKECEEAYNKGYEAGRKEQEPITSKDKFIYALTACGCLLKDGKTWYEHNELIKCFEDLGLFEQEPFINKFCVSSGVCEHDKNKVLDKIRVEIDKIYEREGSSFDCLNALDELKEFIDKYKAESERT